MFLHLGGDYLVRKDKIIAIFDMETAMNNGTSQNFLKGLKEDKKIVYVSDEGKEKTLVITKEGSFLSPISSLTLLKRSNNSEIFVD